jgi:hypoxanthine phosphoribosyltransferase
MMIKNDGVLSEILISREIIQQRVRELGAQITISFRGKKLCICPLLDGGMVFAADLMREIDLPLTLLPIKASSYAGTQSSGVITLAWGIPDEIKGQQILIVDDILDTGRTLETLRRLLLEAGALSVTTCVLLRKEYAKDLPADFIGFEIPDQFVVGYGLDLDGLYRNFPYIGVLKSPAKA